MLIHLEYGNCASGLNFYDVNKTAALCFQWKGYIKKELRHELLKRRSPSEQPFYCPTCGLRLGKLSSLFQHVESPHCGQTLKAGAIGKLKNWLWAHHVYGVVAKFRKWSDVFCPCSRRTLPDLTPLNAWANERVWPRFPSMICRSCICDWTWTTINVIELDISGSRFHGLGRIPSTLSRTFTRFSTSS